MMPMTMPIKDAGAHSHDLALRSGCDAVNAFR